MVHKLIASLFALLLPLSGAFACAENEIDVLGDGSQCEDATFTVTTTDDATQLIWKIAATGTFYIDCGDGGIFSAGSVKVEHATTAAVQYSCTWANADAHTVRFGGAATGYATSADVTATTILFGSTPISTRSKIASISGSLTKLFPQLGTTAAKIPLFRQTFQYCTSLKAIPDQLFADIAMPRSYIFYQTFFGCSSLGGFIPPTTFAKLISSGAPTAGNMWSQTFQNTQLKKSCPDGMAQYITGYEGTTSGSTWTGFVSCGCKQGYWGDGKTCALCTNTIPDHGIYNVSLTDNCSWECDAGYAFSGGICKDAHTSFIVRTINMEANSTFTFTMTANGTFTVDCGDGGVLSGTGVSGKTITRTNTSEATYTCTYSDAGEHDIKFEKVTVTGYFADTTKGTLNFQNNTNVAGIYGSIGAVFPTITPGVKGKTPPLAYMFAGCTNLNSEIPEDLLAGIYGEPVAWQFRNMFHGCTSLEGPIPASLFDSIHGRAKVGVFGHLFRDCTSLKGPIPDNLFSNITGSANYLYANVFDGCTSLDGKIPGNLFGGMAGGAPADYMFRQTFKNCSSLTGPIPETLFKGLSGYTETQTFNSTFENCTSLNGYIPPKLFDGITVSDAAAAMPGIFTGSAIATSCEPFPNTKQYITGFEAGFSGRVSCECVSDEYDFNPETQVCSLPCNGTMYMNACHAPCPFLSVMHVGPAVYPLFADEVNVTTPKMHIMDENGTICHLYFKVQEDETEPAMRVLYNDVVYRAIDPRK